jgi:hypothetical protein
MQLNLAGFSLFIPSNAWAVFQESQRRFFVNIVPYGDHIC